MNFKYKLLLLISVVILLIISKFVNFQEPLQILATWVKSLGIFGPITFIIIYNLATLLFIPGSILTLGAGFVFGLFWGSVYVFIGATIGATVAFLIGRYLARDWVVQKIAGNQKFAAIDQAVAKEGLKIVLLTRLSPIFPFNLLNYAFGITGVSQRLFYWFYRDDSRHYSVCLYWFPSRELSHARNGKST